MSIVNAALSLFHFYERFFFFTSVQIIFTLNVLDITLRSSVTTDH